MNRKGFTLVELLMVVIIIGILVTLAVPNYYKSIERAKGAKVKANMRTLKDAEVIYRNLNDTYTHDFTNLVDQDLPTDLQGGDDGDWTYVPTSTNITKDILITATRSAGPYGTSTVSFDQDSLYTNVDSVLEWD